MLPVSEWQTGARPSQRAPSLHFFLPTGPLPSHREHLVHGGSCEEKCRNQSPASAPLTTSTRQTPL